MEGDELVFEVLLRSSLEEGETGEGRMGRFDRGGRGGRASAFGRHDGVNRRKFPRQFETCVIPEVRRESVESMGLNED